MRTLGQGCRFSGLAAVAAAVVSIFALGTAGAGEAGAEGHGKVVGMAFVEAFNVYLREFRGLKRKTLTGYARVSHRSRWA